jgi:hypothetical protein
MHHKRRVQGVWIESLVSHQLLCLLCSRIPESQRLLRPAECDHAIGIVGCCCHSIHRIAGIQSIYIHPGVYVPPPDLAFATTFVRDDYVTEMSIAMLRWLSTSAHRSLEEIKGKQSLSGGRQYHKCPNGGLRGVVL